MAWHMGYPLSQSLFTSLYIDRLLWPEPTTLEEARFDRGSPAKDDPGLLHIVLRAFCLGLVKGCDFVYQTVSAEHYYEVSTCEVVRRTLSLADTFKEEDFVLSLYNRSLLSRFESNDIFSLLDKAQDTIQNGSLNLSAVLKQALSTRIELRARFLAAVDIDRSDHEQRRKDWEACNKLLPIFKETSNLGKPVESSFSVKMQRKLASTVPPRSIVVVNFDDAWKLLSEICQSGGDAYHILDYRGGTWLQVRSGSNFFSLVSNTDRTRRTSYGLFN